MHPYIAQAVAAERIRDLQNEARAARLAGEARRARRHRAPAAAATPATDPPLSCAEFLVRTAGPLIREPSAAERGHGQAVR